MVPDKQNNALWLIDLLYKLRNYTQDIILNPKLLYNIKIRPNWTSNTRKSELWEHTEMYILYLMSYDSKR